MEATINPEETTMIIGPTVDTTENNEEEIDNVSQAVNANDSVAEETDIQKENDNANESDSANAEGKKDDLKDDSSEKQDTKKEDSNIKPNDNVQGEDIATLQILTESVPGINITKFVKDLWLIKKHGKPFPGFETARNLLIKDFTAKVKNL